MKDLINTACRAVAAWWASRHTATVQAAPTPSTPEVKVGVTTITEEPSMTSKLSAYFEVIKHATDAILAAELSAPASATGADKLDIAKAALEAAYPELGIADVAFEAVWPLVKPFIDAVVAKLKAKAADPVAPAEPVAESAG